MTGSCNLAGDETHCVPSPLGLFFVHRFGDVPASHACATTYVYVNETIDAFRWENIVCAWAYVVAFFILGHTASIPAPLRGCSARGIIGSFMFFLWVLCTILQLLLAFAAAASTVMSVPAALYSGTSSAECFIKWSNDVPVFKVLAWFVLGFHPTLVLALSQLGLGAALLAMAWRVWCAVRRDQHVNVTIAKVFLPCLIFCPTLASLVVFVFFLSLLFALVFLPETLAAGLVMVLLYMMLHMLHRTTDTASTSRDTQGDESGNVGARCGGCLGGVKGLLHAGTAPFAATLLRPRSCLSGAFSKHDDSGNVGSRTGLTRLPFVLSTAALLLCPMVLAGNSLALHVYDGGGNSTNADLIEALYKSHFAGFGIASGSIAGGDTMTVSVLNVNVDADMFGEIVDMPSKSWGGSRLLRHASKMLLLNLLLAVLKLCFGVITKAVSKSTKAVGGTMQEANIAPVDVAGADDWNDKTRIRSLVGAGSAEQMSGAIGHGDIEANLEGGSSGSGFSLSFGSRNRKANKRSASSSFIGRQRAAANRPQTLKVTRKTGLLEKKGQQWPNNWKMRFCVLDGNRLRYFVGQENPSALKGTVRIIGVNNVLDRPGKRPYRFDAVCAENGGAERILALAATDAEDKAGWVKALAEAAGQPVPKEALGTRYDEETTTEEHCVKEFEPQEVMLATDKMSERNKLDEGAFGVVYRGMLADGRDVAIKVLKNAQGASKAPKKYSPEETFKTEAAVLAKYRHRNIVALLGHCIGKDKQYQFLVYEFMAGQSLRMRLKCKPQIGRPRLPALTWSERIDVACDCARALEFLHTVPRPPIVHQDVKSANILLGTGKRGGIIAKIADFGSTRVTPELADDTHVSTKHIVGTKPYMPPEYIQSGHVSEHTDTFAFGVVLLELLTGRPPYEHDTHKMLVNEMAVVLEDIDNRLKPVLDGKAGHVDFKTLCRLAAIAEKCVKPHVHKRCTVMDVRPDLDEIAERDPNAAYSFA